MSRMREYSGGTDDPITQKALGMIDAPGAPSKIGIFVVDDHEIVTDGVARIIENTPEQDMVLVGSDRAFSDNLPDLLRETCADVVLMDLALVHEHDRRGLGAIRTIRRALGSRLGIVAYTAFPNLRTLALDCGADTWLTKGATNDRLRNALRTCKDHDTLSRLELFLDSREAIVAVSRNGTQTRVRKLPLARDAFALLYYLAEERSRNESDWLKKPVEEDEKGVPYEFKNTSMWSEICTRWHTKAVERWDNMEISRYVTMMNKSVRDELQLPDEAKFVIVPGGGRKAGVPSMYCLNEFIGAREVLFHGQRL